MSEYDDWGDYEPDWQPSALSPGAYFDAKRGPEKEGAALMYPIPAKVWASLYFGITPHKQ